MATEADAREFTLQYTGGSLTMTLGALKSIFGADFDGLQSEGVQKSVTVKSHTRVRVIGQPATTVGGFSYTYTQWPTSQANNADAGRIILADWEGSEGEWTGRVTGSFADLGVYLNATSPVPIKFRSERGTKYGTFLKTN